MCVHRISETGPLLVWKETSQKTIAHFCLFTLRTPYPFYLFFFHKFFQHFFSCKMRAIYVRSLGKSMNVHDYYVVIFPL